MNDPTPLPAAVAAADAGFRASPPAAPTPAGPAAASAALPRAGEPAIAVRDLVCGYGATVVLRDLTFEVAPGEIFFVIGGSGCGKSTLLRHLIGLRPPLGGTVQFFGEDFSAASGDRQRELLREFGVLYQSAALWSSMTLRENVCLPLELHTPLTRDERDEIVALKLSQVGLSGYEDYYPSEISGGMKKRAGLARALALDPRVVFFDEPGAGLDPITSRQMDELILEIRATLGTTCVIVSHELESIFGIADRVILLEKEAQGIIATGDPRQLVAHSTDPRVTAFLRRGKQPAGAAAS